jgi:hypothetical protein
MRIHFPPTTRIASGLLLAVLLSIAGYRVMRQWNPRDPETLLRPADKMSWLNNWIRAERFHWQTKLQYIQSHRLSMALCTIVGQLPKHTDSSNAIPDLRFDEESSGLFESPISMESIVLGDRQQHRLGEQSTATMSKL